MDLPHGSESARMCQGSTQTPTVIANTILARSYANKHVCHFQKIYVGGWSKSHTHAHVCMSVYEYDRQRI